MGTKSKTKKYVVIRSNQAGVFIGELISLDVANRYVVLGGSIRLWSWAGASLSQVALEGHKDESKNTCVTIEGEHIVFDLVEVIPSNAKAYKQIASLKRWRA